MSLSAAEWKRKAVHAGMGLFALLLRWLDWKQAALLAVLALLFNLFVMPRIGRGIYRDSARPRDAGILAYPAMVLLLIVLFRSELGAAAALWGMMAFGDPAATIAGRLLGGPALPWNPKKRWSGLAAYMLAGLAAAAALWRWVSLGNPPLWLLPPVVLLGAFLESLETGLDDNWIPPIPCALLLAFEYTAMASPRFWSELPSPRLGLALAVNAVVASVTLALRIVAPSGAVAGAVVGWIVLAFGGWAAYAVLWAFFLFGTLATRLGYRRKRALGTAQPERGRRSARHVLANCGVAAFLSLLGSVALPVRGGNSLLAVPFAAALAAALADTLGTEIGSLYGRRPISLALARIVPPGTAGAVSGAGLGGGFLGALAIGLVAAAANLVPWNAVWIVAAGGVSGSLAESLLADLGRRGGVAVDHDFANVFNTFVGAVVALEIFTWVRQGYVSLPFDWRGM